MNFGGDDVDEWRSLNKNKNSEELSYVAAGKLDFGYGSVLKGSIVPASMAFCFQQRFFAIPN